MTVDFERINIEKKIEQNESKLGPIAIEFVNLKTETPILYWLYSWPTVAANRELWRVSLAKYLLTLLRSCPRVCSVKGQ